MHKLCFTVMFVGLSLAIHGVTWNRLGCWDTVCYYLQVGKCARFSLLRIVSKTSGKSAICKENLTPFQFDIRILVVGHVQYIYIFFLKLQDKIATAWTLFSHIAYTHQKSLSTFSINLITENKIYSLNMFLSNLVYCYDNIPI